MSKGLKWFLGIFGTLFLGIAILFFQLRFHDGPMEIISGGPFKTGEVVSGTSDWTFLTDRQTIEMQTMLPPRSRTMWLVVHDNRVFVISSYMNTRLGKIWKQWPRKVDEDNRAILRADGNLFNFTLQRIQSDNAASPVVLEKFNGKYNTEFSKEVLDSGSSWLFELKPA